MATNFGYPGVDQAYRSGPEDLVAQASAIAAGVVVSYDKEPSHPATADPSVVPSTWTAHGTVAVSEYLKGNGQGRVAFSREEHSFGMPGPPERPEWEDTYGDLGPGQKAVVFFLGDVAHRSQIVVPTGSGEHNLEALVGAIAKIQAIGDPRVRIPMWARYAQTATHDADRKAALRSLLKEKASFAMVYGTLEGMFSDPSLSADMRGYMFGFAVFGVTHDLWPASTQAEVDFLCRTLEHERNAEALLKYLLNLKVLIRYTMEEQTRVAREPLRLRIATALRNAQSEAATSAEIAEQYRDIRVTYPNFF